MNLAVPRVVDGIGAVVVVTGGAARNHSLVTTAEGRVLVFGYKGGGGGYGEGRLLRRRLRA